MLNIFFSGGKYGFIPKTSACHGQAGHDPHHLKRSVRQLNAPGIFRLQDNTPYSGYVYARSIGTQKGFHNLRHQFYDVILYGDPKIVFIPHKAHAFAAYGHNL